MTPPPSSSRRPPSLRAARRVDVSFATFWRAFVVVALAWAWWQLWQWVLVFVLAAFIAVALDPAVLWLEAHRVRRRYGAPLLVLAIVLVLAGFVAVSAASLTQDARDLGARLNEFRGVLADRVPKELQQAATALAPSPEALTSAAQGFVGGLAGVGFALVVTVYLLLDGRRTVAWLIAFAPARSRGRARETAECARAVVAAYVRGNVITSVITAVATWIALAAMQVPASLLLALLAGILDFVPVVGFLLSAAPAVLLGLTVSPAVGAGVALFYLAYNAVENYYIQPKVYGREMKLSDLAVISAFLVGGVLGGVLGALIALPIAAVYLDVERIWFDGPSDTDTADEHQRLAAQAEDESA